MHPLHEYIATQLAEQVAKRHVVVWYDERAEFPPFVDELRGGPRTDVVAPVELNGAPVHLAEYAGSMFELRAAVEPFVRGDAPEDVVVYLPGCARDTRGSVLMELEKAGTTWQPQLRQLARNLLVRRHALGAVDDMLSADRKLGYADLARIAADGGTATPSVLTSVFTHSTTDDTLLAAWLADDSRDGDIIGKAAAKELVALVHSRLGLGLDLPGRVEPADLAKLRGRTLRYVLASEFRLDLSGPPPAALDGVPTPPTPKAEQAVRTLAHKLRSERPGTYPSLADRVERELRLGTAALPPDALGSIDTFRFAERELLGHIGDLIAAGRFDEALTLVSRHKHGFWLGVAVERRAQWEAARLMAELGQIAAQVRAAVSVAGGDAREWVERYTAADGWYRLDQAQRRLEAWMTELDDPQERPLGVVRRAYEDTCQLMAEGFTKALAASGWAVAGTPHQTGIFNEVVSAQPKPVAYFLVDAMRYEMGQELVVRLPDTSEFSVRPAVGALPSITPIGMAALLPSASGSFSIAAQGDRFGARIGDAFLPDLAARKKFAGARIPGLVDLTLNELLSLSQPKLAKKVAGARVVVVRSQEIDHAGETAFAYPARQIMDTVIDNLARALRRLAAAGVGHAVVTADHGHLFFGSDRDESMRTDAPRGQTVDLHRRCWIGRGGTNPPGTVRVTAAELGYTSDLDLVFPAGAGVFKAGGSLAFHHGGPSLQELVIPVVTVRSRTAHARPTGVADQIDVAGLPDVITNRIFTVTFSLGDGQLPLIEEGLLVRPMLVADGRQVGAVGMALGAEFDSAAERLPLAREKAVTVAFRLIDDTVPALRVVVLDLATDAELYRSPADIPVRLGVS